MGPSLLDQMSSAKGLPPTVYLTEGRTVLSLVSLYWREPNSNLDRPQASFKIVGSIIKTSSPVHTRGQIVTISRPFKFVQDDLAAMRRDLAAIATSMQLGSGEDGYCSEDEANTRAKEFVGPTNPLRGAIFVVDAFTKNGKPFTHYVVQVPGASDLE